MPPCRRRPPQPHRSRRLLTITTGGESGAAVVEYLLVAVVVVMVFVSVAQVAVLVHARDVLVADAAEGARLAALQGSSLAAGEKDCQALVATSLPGLAGSTQCSAGVLARGVASPALVVVAASAAVHVWLLPGGQVHLHVSARSVLEPPA